MECPICQLRSSHKWKAHEPLYFCNAFVGATALDRNGEYTTRASYASSYFDALNVERVSVEQKGSLAQDKNAFMKIELVEHTLTINPNGGSWNNNSGNSSFTMGDNETKTIADPTRTGYTFAGWTVSGTGSSITGTTFTMGSADTTLTANWTQAQYTVTVNKGTGIGSVTGGGTYTYGEQVTVTATLPTNTAQYTYGWSNWTGTGISGSNNQTYTFTMPAGNVTLTANGTETLNQYLQTIKYRYQNADGTYPTIYTNAINQNYNYGAKVSWNTSSINGFDTNTYQSASVAEYTVTGANTKTVDIPRKTYALTVNKGTGIASVTGANTYRVGQTVTVTATPLAGYTWKNWTGTGVSGSNNQTYTFTMPTSTVTVTANATLNTYTITYNLGGGTATGNPENYTVETETFTLKNPTRTGYTFTGWTGSNGETPQTTVTINKGSTENKNYTANWEARTDTPYTVKHWQQTVDASTEGRTEENGYNYTEVEEDRKILTGTTDTKGTENVKEYTGFTAPEKKEITITGDGKAVLNYYYTRNKYKLTLKAGKGISSSIATGMDEEGEKAYPYDKKITINARIYVGYVWDKWEGKGLKNADGTEKLEIEDIKYEFNMPANDVEYEGSAIPNPDTTYTIKHWTQKLEGTATDFTEKSYKLEETEVLMGETDSKVSPKTKEYEGFKAPDAEGISIPITGEGTLVIDYYYKRNYYDVVLNKGKGIEDIKVTGNITGEGKDKYLYEEEVTIEAKVKSGYTWDKWTVGGNKEEEENTTVSNIEHTFTIGTENVEYIANATANTDTPYKVQHWQQNLPTETTNDIENTNQDDVGAGPVSAQENNQENYTLIDTEEKTGTTGATVTPETKEYAGFTAPETQTAEILGDGSLVVNYYYTRNTNTPYIVKHWQQKLPTETTNDEQNEENYTLTDTEEKTGTTGATVTPETKEYVGFTAPKTQTVTILADGNLVVNYYYTRNTNTPYVVKHWKENLPVENTEDNNQDNVGAGPVSAQENNQENYTLIETERLTGTTGATVTPEVKEYAGFTAPTPEEVEILADGSLVVNYYYTRNTNTPYKVNHWIQNLGGNAGVHNDKNYTIRETQNLEGLTEGKVIPDVTEYDGFISPETEEITILADGSSILNYYYTRRTDLTCIITHIDKGTGKTIFTRTIKNLTYEEEIDGTEEIMDIEDYKYESIEPETLTVGTGENRINIYYAKKEGKIIVHHYIYDEKENKYTTTKLVEDDEIIGAIGNNYRAEASSKIPENYIVVDETPENCTGIIEGGTKEVTYYYKLKTPKIDSEVGGELAEGGKQDEDGKWEVKAGEEIKYRINYKTKIEDYKGKAKIEIKAELPEGTQIDQEKCDFAGGTYDKATNTVNWTKEIEEINTFENGTYTEEIIKEITIVYAEDYKLESIELDITGKTILYYPNEGDGEEDKPLVEDETDENGKVIIHHYIYDEKTDTYTTEKIVEDEEIVKKVGEEYISKKTENIPENYTCINEKPEGYKGTIEKETKEISYYYKLKEPTVDGEAGGELEEGGNSREDGKWEVKAGEEIKYKIKYKTEIEDYKGKASIEIKAELPEGTKIDEENCDFTGGTYDEETNTIKWTKEIEEIDTFKNGNYKEEIEKDITIVYAEDYILDEITPKVTGKTILYYPDNYPTEGDGTLTEDETDGKGKIIIHHYIYDEKTNTYTKEKLVENEQIKGEIGKEYTTRPSEKIPSNYECINREPEGYKGKYTKETIKVNYYYKLKTPKTESEIKGEVISGGEKNEDGKWVIKVGEEVKYKISYKTKIIDYKGKAKIEITAKLPEGTGINKERCNLAGGTYNEEIRTINWVKEIEEIDTFLNGPYTEEIEKEITIVYDNDYVLEDMGLKVTGKTILYYPENYPIEKDEPFIKDEIEEKKEKGKIIVHHYIYDKEDNKYLNIKLVQDEEIEKEIGENYETKPSEKVPSNYECINEKPEGHEGTIEKETKEISYYYKLKETKTEGTGNSNIKTELEKDEEGKWVIKAGEEVEYEVTYEIKIEDYIGKATVEIKAELPEGTKIELNKSDLNGGTYDEVANTITWVKEIENIDTFANGPYTEKLTQDVKIVYTENYTLKDANLKVTGNIITYYPEGYPDKGGQTLPKEDEPNNPEEKTGKVIVKYVDIDTNEEIIKIQNTDPDDVGAIVNRPNIEGTTQTEKNTKPQTYRYEITGKIGEAYETEEKDIPYYILVRKAENSKGEIKEEEQVVTYYYRKLNFNIGIEKTIGTITLNGKDIKIDNKETSKLEIKKEDIKNTEIIVKYNIKVTNKGELGGTSKVLELIPEGYELAYLPEYWKVNRDETLETNVELEAGESKELEVVLRWENKENNLGAKTNIAKIEETKNEANFKDTNEEDNKSEATIVLGIKTGETASTIIIVMIMGSLVICSYITIKTIKKKAPDIKDIKFLN